MNMRVGPDSGRVTYRRRLHCRSRPLVLHELRDKTRGLHRRFTLRGSCIKDSDLVFAKSWSGRKFGAGTFGYQTTYGSLSPRKLPRVLQSLPCNIRMACNILRVSIVLRIW